MSQQQQQPGYVLSGPSAPVLPASNPSSILPLSFCPVCLQDAKLKYSDIDEVILVGGSTRIPAVQVRRAAGYSCGWILCCCSCCRLPGGSMLAWHARLPPLLRPCSSSFPAAPTALLPCLCLQELVQKISQKTPNVTVNPDEVVALGAAVQGGVLAGEVSTGGTRAGGLVGGVRGCWMP